MMRGRCNKDAPHAQGKSGPHDLRIISRIIIRIAETSSDQLDRIYRSVYRDREPGVERGPNIAGGSIAGVTGGCKRVLGGDNGGTCRESN